MTYNNDTLGNIVFHYRSLTVRLIKSSDIEQVELLCQGIDESDQVIADIKQYLVAKRDHINEVWTVLRKNNFDTIYYTGSHTHLLCCC